jgi:4'-phosphopantetheinyl transferase
VWWSRLDCGPDQLWPYENVLAEDERARAARFHFEKDRADFVAARGILRELLGRSLDEDPAVLKFDYGDRGKPFLRQQNNYPIRFNISHSHGVAVFAFCLRHEIGADVEQIHAIDSEEIAQRFFSTSEIEELRSVPEEKRNEAFFCCWTRKEAYVKALGDGLQVPLNSFSVSLTPGQPPTLKSADSGRWNLFSFEPTGGYVAAVLVEGQNLRLNYQEWKIGDPNFT